MRIAQLLLVTALLAGGAQVTRAQAPATPEAQVRAVVERYLHGLKFNDTKDLEAAFWPDARLMFVRKDGSIGQLTQQEWYKMFAGAEGKEEQGTLKILAVDVTDNAASVKVIETYPKSVYVDYLNLLHINGEWRIVNKIYTSRPNP
jgi:ABC-type transporter MlaC component